MESHKFLFVAGLHRSGTSLITECISEHPQISGFKNTGVYQDEGQYLQTVYPRPGQPGGDAPGRFGFDPRTYLTEESSIATTANTEKLFSQWRSHWDLSKKVLLEKSPPNIVRTRFLQACFPNSYFLLVTRHPIANAMATKKWCRKNPLSGIILNWLVCHRKFEQDKSKLANAMTMKYEDFTRNPESCLSRIGQFLGVGDIPLNREINPSINEKYFKQWCELKEKPKGSLDTGFSSLFFEPKVNRYGYSFQEGDWLIES